MRPRPLALVVVVALASCTSQGGDRPTRARRTTAAGSTAASAAPAATAAAPSAPTGSAGALPGAASAARPSASGAPGARTAPVGDACRVTRGPIQLSFTGPALLVAGVAGSDPYILFNRDGHPQAVTLPAARKDGAAGAAVAPPGAASLGRVPPNAPSAPSAPKPSEPHKPERLSLGEPAERAGWPACAGAGGVVFCGDKAGHIRRSSVTGEGAVVVAEARPGSPVAAATIAGNHVVYAFLADRKGADGAVTVAFAGLDDAPPVVLSEDGAGATHIALASRGEEAVATYVDARRVLTPVHARVLTGAGKLGLGPDAVLFVGSGTDGRTPAAIAQGGSGVEHVLLPMDKDDRAFGLAAIRIDEQPHDDATTVWSLYTAAIEHPVVAATQGAWPIRVLRTRPGEGDAKGKVVLELGELDAAGVWKALCPVAEGAAFADPTLLVDPTGALWIAYTDADGTWIERRGR